MTGSGPPSQITNTRRGVGEGIAVFIQALSGSEGIWPICDAIPRLAPGGFFGLVLPGVLWAILGRIRHERGRIRGEKLLRMRCVESS